MTRAEHDDPETVLWEWDRRWGYCRRAEGVEVSPVVWETLAFATPRDPRGGQESYQETDARYGCVMWEPCGVSERSHDA